MLLRAKMTSSSILLAVAIQHKTILTQQFSLQSKTWNFQTTRLKTHNFFLHVM